MVFRSDGLNRRAGTSAWSRGLKKKESIYGPDPCLWLHNIQPEEFTHVIHHVYLTVT